MDRRNEIVSLLEELIKSLAGTAAAVSAKDHILPYLEQVGSFETAITYASELLQQNRESESKEPNYLFQVASIYRRKSGGVSGSDLSNALSHYQELIQKYPNSDFAFLADLELDRIGGGTLGREAAENLTSVTTPRSFVLYPNYPNPFNPETRIKFHLKDEERVLLRIYDVSGKLVRTLVDEIYDQGDHIISWDSKDSNSLSVASGIYLMELTVNHERQIGRMVLVR